MRTYFPNPVIEKVKVIYSGDPPTPGAYALLKEQLHRLFQRVRQNAVDKLKQFGYRQACNLGDFVNAKLYIVQCRNALFVDVHTYQHKSNFSLTLLIHASFSFREKTTRQEGFPAFWYGNNSIDWAICQPTGFWLRYKLFKEYLTIPYHFQKDIMGYFNSAAREHLLLSLLLFLQQFHFSRDVSAVEIAGHILAQGRDSACRYYVPHCFCLDF